MKLTKQDQPPVSTVTYEIAMNALWRAIFKLEAQVKRLEQGPKQPANVRRPEDV